MTQSLAIIVNDPDAPKGNVIHWVTWGIPANTQDLAENAEISGKGANTSGKTGFRGHVLRKIVRLIDIFLGYMLSIPN